MFNDQNFNDKLTNDIVSFEQLDPDFFILIFLQGDDIVLAEMVMVLNYCINEQ